LRTYRELASESSLAAAGCLIPFTTEPTRLGGFRAADHAPAIRLFYTGNGLIIGMSIPSAIFLWLEGNANPGAQNGSGGIAMPGSTTPSGKEPSQIP
jgi:hypothetical protein